MVGGALALTYRADPRGFLWAAAFQVVGALAPTALVLIGQYLLTQLTGADGGRVELSVLVLPVAALAAVTALTLAAGSLQQHQQRLLGERVAARAWQQVLDVSTRVKLSLYEAPEFYDQLQRIKNNAFIQHVAVTSAVFGMVGGGVGVVGLLIALLSIDPVLIPILLVAGVPSILLARRVSRLEFAFLVRGTPVFRLREYLRDTLSGREEAKEIRVFAAEAALRRRHDERNREYDDLLAAHIAVRKRYSIIDVAVSSVLLAATLTFVVWSLSTGRIALAAAAAAVLAVRFVSTALGQLFRSVGSLFEASTFLADMRRFVVDLVPDSEPPASSPEGVGPLRTALTLDGVSFTYPGAPRPALTDVDLRIGSDEIVALVGENGSGKTTLAKLIAGLYTPSTGRIRWDDVDTSTVPAADVRRQISVIFQDYVRYQLTAQDNVGLGEPDELDDAAAARDAAGQARALEYLDALPHGMDTMLSKEFPGGQDLSQGQWQRVALARALRKRSSLVVLDEPTASLDPKSEAQLFADIRATLRGRAGLLISHRFSSVRLADRIYVLQQGRVVETGTHAELVALGGLYADLFRAQADAYLR